MSRETNEFTTPAGRKVVLNAYFTGKESNAINAIAFKGANIDTTQAQDGKVSMDTMSAEAIIPQQELMMKYMVVSIDEDTSADPGELPESEYNAIVAEVTKRRVPLEPTK